MAVRVAATIEPMNGQTYPVADASNISGLATVATSGDYNDLINRPSGSTDAEYAQKIGTSQSHPAIGSEELPVYVKNTGEVKPIKSVVLNDAYLKTRSGGIEQKTYQLDVWNDSGTSMEYLSLDSWTAYQSLHPESISERLRLTVGNVEYHIDFNTDFDNLDNICPNASSQYIDHGYMFVDSDSNTLPGVGVVLLSGVLSEYVLVADKVIYTGTDAPTSLTDAVIVCAEISDVVKSEARAEKISVTRIEDLDGIYSSRMLLHADHLTGHGNFFKNNLQDSSLGFWFLQVEVEFDAQVSLVVDGVTHTGFWYRSTETFPGYSTITGLEEALEGVAYDYCYFTDKAVLVYMSAYGQSMCLLAVDDSLYSSLTGSDFLSTVTYSQDSCLSLKGRIELTGEDSNSEENRGKISAVTLEAPKLSKIKYVTNSDHLAMTDGSSVYLNIDDLSVMVSTVTESSTDYYATVPTLMAKDYSFYEHSITVAINGTNYTGTWSGESQSTTSLVPPSYLTNAQYYYYINEHMLCVQLYLNNKYCLSFCCDSTTQSSISHGSIYMIPKDGRTTVKGCLYVEGSDSESYENGALSANKIRCHGTEMYKGEKYRRSTFVDLQSNTNWSTYKNCFECGYPKPIIMADNWSSDNKAEFAFYGLSSTYGSVYYYADRSQIAEADLKTYCPNADSYTIQAFPITRWDDTTRAYVNVPGMCMSAATNDQNGYILWIDSTIYPGSNNIPDFITTDSAYVYSYYTTNDDVGYIYTNELSTTNLGVSADISTPRLRTSVYGTKQEYNRLMQYKDLLSYYSSWGTYRTANIKSTYGLYKGQALAIDINGSIYYGTWYDGGEGPGYSGTGYSTGSYDYCYFTAECCLVCTTSSAMRLLVNTNTYSNIQEYDYFYDTIQVPTTDGTIEVNGVLRVSGSDSYEKGTIYCSKIVKNQYSENQNMEIQAAIKLPMRVEGEDLASYWEATTSGLYTCTKELDIAPFDYVYIYWDSADVPSTSVTITAEDWWIDSGNNAFGFNVFNNTGTDAKPISVWYNTTTHLFKMWEDAQTGNAIPTSMYISYCKTNGVTTRTVIQNTDDGNYTNPRKTIATPGCIAMTDSQSGLVIKPDQIRVGNPGDSTGTTVTISRNSIAIGNTTINEAQLQALLELINSGGGGRSATMGVMSIVE